MPVDGRYKASSEVGMGRLHCNSEQMKQLLIPLFAIICFTVATCMSTCRERTVPKALRIPDMLLPHEDSPIVDGVRTLYVTINP